MRGWVVAGLDYGVRLEQTAISLPNGRVQSIPLENDALDTERRGGNPGVAVGVAVESGGVMWFDAKRTANPNDMYWRR